VTNGRGVAPCFCERKKEQAKEKRSGNWEMMTLYRDNMMGMVEEDAGTTSHRTFTNLYLFTFGVHNHPAL
jgi:hypothetical protein